MARISLKTLCFALIVSILVFLLYHRGSLVLSPAENYNPISNFPAKTSSESSNNKIYKKMEQKIISEHEKNAKQLLKLPNPKDIIKEAKGPLKKKNKQSKKMSNLEKISLLLESMKCTKQEFHHKDHLLLILGRPASGLEQFLPALHMKHGVFILQDESPIKSVQNLKYSLTNLSRCAIVLTTNKNNNSTKVIQEENLQDFPLKHNSFIVNSCDQKCVTSPKLWTQLCEKFNFKALTLNQFDLILVKDLLKDDSINIDIIYLTRDPRAMIYEKLLENPKLDISHEASDLCKTLSKDLKVMPPYIPKFHFHTLRFEEFQLKPNEEITSHIKGLHTLSKFCQKSDPPIPKQNPAPELIDTWKLKLSMEEIMTIEDKCTSVLNRLEYPIYGSNFLND